MLLLFDDEVVARTFVVVVVVAISGAVVVACEFEHFFSRTLSNSDCEDDSRYIF